MTTTPSTTVAVPREVLQAAREALIQCKPMRVDQHSNDIHCRCVRCQSIAALGLYLTPPSDLPANLNPNPKGGEPCPSSVASAAASIHQEVPSALAGSKGASGVPSTTSPDLPTRVAGEDEAKAKMRAEFLHRHQAPKDWVILTIEEME